MKRPASNTNPWEDHYTRKARKENFPARSVYKLDEIQKKFQIIKSGYRVLDLGCAPGGWTLLAARLVGKTGQVVGIDLKPVTSALPENVKSYIGDVFDLDPDVQSVVGEAPFDVVLCDMAPSTTGSTGVDALRSMALCEAALSMSTHVLRPGGDFVCKIFQGPDFQAFISLIKKDFVRYKIFKPQSSRKASREIYIIGFDRKSGGTDVRTQQVGDHTA